MKHQRKILISTGHNTVPHAPAAEVLYYIARISSFSNNGAMPDNLKPKPLAHFPSALAQESISGVLPKRRGVLKRLLSSLFKLTLIVGLLGAGLFFYLSRGPVSNERLRVEVVSALSSILGPNLSAEVNEAHISIGENGTIAVAADRVKIRKDADSASYGDAEHIQIGIKLLPMLKGDFKVKTILIEDSTINTQHIGLDGQDWSGEWPDAFHLEKIMRLPAERLFYLSKSMGIAGLEKVTWRNLRINRLKLAGDLSKDIIIQEMVVRVQDETGNLSIDAVASFGLRDVHLKGTWDKTDGNFALNLDLDGLDANDFVQNAVSSTDGAIGLNAPLKLAYHHPYDRQMNSGQSTLRVDISRGIMRFGHDDLVAFTGGQFNLRLLPGKNQIELEKSPVYFTKSSAVLTGGIRFPLSSNPENPIDKNRDQIDAANLRKPIFELIANDIVANPADSPGQEVNATFKVAGKLDPLNRVLEMDEINLWTPGGNLHGAGSFGFAGETPSLAVALTIPRMSVESAKQIWPVFIATKARRWAIDNIAHGEITGARIDAAIPSGILGRIREGKKLTPEQLSVHLNVAGATIKTIGEMPAIEQAKGTLLFQGMETEIKLSAGIIQMENGRSVDATNGIINIGDFQDEPTIAKLNLNLKGQATDILQIGAQKPLKLVEVTKIQPKDISGKANIDLNITFPLIKELDVSDVDWSARMKLSEVTLAKPLQGRKLSKANVLIFAKPGLATIKGKVRIDGVTSTIDMSQPFGDNQNGKSKQIVKLTLNRKARSKMGLNLDSVLKGTVTASLTSIGEEGGQKVSVDLTRAVLSLPWINWTKGSGIKGTASFTMRTSDKNTRISDFRLAGAGFSVVGNLDLDRRGITKAKFSKLVLNKGDNLKVSVLRTKRGYIINANGASYDARAIINQVLNLGTPKSDLTNATQITLKASIASVKGFGDVALSNVLLNYTQRNGQLARTTLTGTTNGSRKTKMSIIPKNGITTTELVSSNAGAALRFLNIYSKMTSGVLSANLKQKGNGPHQGAIKVTNFRLKNEPRLKNVLSQRSTNASKKGRDQPVSVGFLKIDPNDVKVNIVTAEIVKDSKSLIIENGLLRASDVGSNFSGIVYDAAGNMNLKGTYLPGYGLNKMVSKIPIVNLAFGDGTKRGFLGITYRLRGKAKNPKITVNPISVIAPGVFRKIFEFK